MLGIEPPDKFPLVYYRENCADIELNIDDVLAAPVTAAKVFQFAGTNLAKDPSRSATSSRRTWRMRPAATWCSTSTSGRTSGTTRGHLAWPIRSVLPFVSIVIGTEDEINASMLTDPSQMVLTHSQVSDTRVAGDAAGNIRRILEMGPRAVVEKVGAKGARVHLASGEVIEARGYPVEVYNILGAGDAFGAGFLYGYVNGWGWQKSARLGNACGAIVVTKHGCANFMPTLEEVTAFAAARGGF